MQLPQDFCKADIRHNRAFADSRILHLIEDHSFGFTCCANMLDGVAHSDGDCLVSVDCDSEVRHALSNLSPSV